MAANVSAPAVRVALTVGAGLGEARSVFPMASAVSNLPGLRRSERIGKPEGYVRYGEDGHRSRCGDMRSRAAKPCSAILESDTGRETRAGSTAQ